MKGTNWLASIFDWLGDALERFNPSAFRFLAAVLPYLTPIPVAWLTAHSSSTFLKFTQEVSFIFVFALEGIGLWFTTMLVDAVVDWIRSKNWKSFFIVLIFLVTVLAYVRILVDLNVTLESAVGSPNPALSRVITLLCYLPLITGIGNGYYKLKLDYKTDAQLSREREDLRQDKIRQERYQERMERFKIKHEKLSSTPVTYQKVTGNLPSQVESFQQVSTDWRKISEKLTSTQIQFIASHEPKEIVEECERIGVHISPRTASNWKKNAMKKLEAS